jgi:hypothetical protein
MSKEKIWLGIDPGVSKSSPGGISFINKDSTDYKSHYMPFDAHGIKEVLREMHFGYNIVFATIEDIHARGGRSATSQGVMMENKGMCIGCVASLDIPLRRVTPHAWQLKMIGKISKEMKEKDKKITKKLSLLKAREMFPAEDYSKSSKDDGKSDSILIAKYGMDYL